LNLIKHVWDLKVKERHTIEDETEKLNSVYNEVRENGVLFIDDKSKFA
jgi:hypothetical protein